MSLFLLALAKWIIVLILLVYQHRRNSGNLLLAGGLLMMSLFDLNHYLAISGISAHLTAMLYQFSSPWVTLIGPLFYLYKKHPGRSQQTVLDGPATHYPVLADVDQPHPLFYFTIR